MNKAKDDEEEEDKEDKHAEEIENMKENEEEIDHHNHTINNDKGRRAATAADPQQPNHHHHHPNRHRKRTRPHPQAAATTTTNTITQPRKETVSSRSPPPRVQRVGSRPRQRPRTAVVLHQSSHDESQPRKKREHVQEGPKRLPYRFSSSAASRRESSSGSVVSGYGVGVPLPPYQYETTLIRVKGNNKDKNDQERGEDISWGMKLTITNEGQVVIQHLNALRDGRASPAQLSGVIRPGDILLSVNHVSLVQLPLDALFQALGPLSSSSSSAPLSSSSGSGSDPFPPPLAFASSVILRLRTPLLPTFPSPAVSSTTTTIQAHHHHHQTLTASMKEDSDPPAAATAVTTTGAAALFSMIMVDQLSGMPLFDSNDTDTWETDQREKVQPPQSTEQPPNHEAIHYASSSIPGTIWAGAGGGWSPNHHHYVVVDDELISADLAHIRRLDQRRFVSEFFAWRRRRLEQYDDFDDDNHIHYCDPSIQHTPDILTGYGWMSLLPPPLGEQAEPRDHPPPLPTAVSSSSSMENTQQNIPPPPPQPPIRLLQQPQQPQQQQQQQRGGGRRALLGAAALVDKLEALDRGEKAKSRSVRQWNTTLSLYSQASTARRRRADWLDPLLPFIVPTTMTTTTTTPNHTTGTSSKRSRSRIAVVSSSLSSQSLVSHSPRVTRYTTTLRRRRPQPRRNRHYRRHHLHNPTNTNASVPLNFGRLDEESCDDSSSSNSDSSLSENEMNSDGNKNDKSDAKNHTSRNSSSDDDDDLSSTNGEPPLDADSKLVRLAATDEVWRQQVVQYLEKASLDRNQEEEETEKEGETTTALGAAETQQPLPPPPQPIPDNRSMDTALSTELGSFFLGESMNKIVTKQKQSQALPPDEITALLYDLTTKLIAAIPGEVAAATGGGGGGGGCFHPHGGGSSSLAAGSHMSHQSSSTHFMSNGKNHRAHPETRTIAAAAGTTTTTTTTTTTAAQKSEIALAARFVREDVLPIWLKSFKPLPWDQRRVLWPRDKALTMGGSTTASTFSDDSFTQESVGMASHMFSTSGSPRTAKRGKNKNLRERIEDLELNAESRAETCYLMTYYYTEKLLPKSMPVADLTATRIEEVCSFVRTYGSYLNLHSCLVRAAALQASDVIEVLLELAHHDPIHNESMRIGLKFHSLVFYESTLLSSILERLRNIKNAVVTLDARLATIDLCAASYPDVQPWQVRHDCLVNNTSDASETTPLPDLKLKKELDDLYYNYLTQLLHPMDGHDAARKVPDLVQEWCELSVRDPLDHNHHDDGNNIHQRRRNFMSVASRTSSDHLLYVRDLALLLQLSHELGENSNGTTLTPTTDLELDLIGEILDSPRPRPRGSGGVGDGSHNAIIELAVHHLQSLATQALETFVVEEEERGREEDDDDDDDSSSSSNGLNSETMSTMMRMTAAKRTLKRILRIYQLAEKFVLARELLRWIGFVSSSSCGFNHLHSNAHTSRRRRRRRTTSTRLRLIRFLADEAPPRAVMDAVHGWMIAENDEEDRDRRSSDRGSEEDHEDDKSTTTTTMVQKPTEAMGLIPMLQIILFRAAVWVPPVTTTTTTTELSGLLAKLRHARLKLESKTHTTRNHQQQHTINQRRLSRHHNSNSNSGDESSSDTDSHHSKEPHSNIWTRMGAGMVPLIK